VNDICDAAQIKLAYLPPYSPDLNPIEEAFAELKAWCKLHRKEAVGRGFEEFLNYAMANLPNDARGHFVKCQVGRDVDYDDEGHEVEGHEVDDGSEEDYWNH
jgi:hypothetical protein